MNLSEKKIFIIEHRNMPAPDRGQIYLAQLGFRVQLIAPHLGEPLPELNGETAGILIMGGPQYVTHTEEFPYLRDEMAFIDRAMKQEIPLLGICLGAQLVARNSGAQVASHQDGSVAFGYYELHPTSDAQDFVPGGFHAPAGNVQGFELPPGGTLLASGNLFPNQAFRVGKNTYGLQFHPEVTRPILDQWQLVLAENFGKPGTHSRERQDADFALYDDPLHNWYTAFLDGLFGRPE